VVEFVTIVKMKEADAPDTFIHSFHLPKHEKLQDFSLV
jgi:hypothetical protein